jgi:hypothetical protein
MNTTHGSVTLPGFLESPNAAAFNAARNTFAVPLPGDLSMTQMAGPNIASSNDSSIVSRTTEFVKSHRMMFGIAGGIAALGLSYVAYRSFSGNDSDDRLQKLNQKNRQGQSGDPRLSENKGYLTIRSASLDDATDYAFVNAIAIKSLDLKKSMTDDEAFINMWVFFRDDGSLDTSQFEPLEKARAQNPRLVVQRPSGDTDQTVFVDDLHKKQKNSKSVTMLIGVEGTPSTVCVDFDRGIPIFVVKPIASTQSEKKGKKADKANKDAAATTTTKTPELIYHTSHGRLRIARLVDGKEVDQKMRERQHAVMQVMTAPSATQAAKPPQQPGPMINPAFPPQGMEMVGTGMGGESVAFQGDEPHWQLPNVDPMQGATQAHPSDIDIDINT